jgi:lysophospholipase L1-like esterase
MTDFNYSNLPVRKSGPFLRIGAKVLPGVRKVQKQIVPHAEGWQRHNALAITEIKPTWVVLGDSMSQGVGAGHHKNGLVGQLEQLLKADGHDYRVINLSISGARIRDVLDIQLPALDKLNIKPDLVTCLVGANDMVRKRFRVDAPANFDELLRKLPKGSIVGNSLGASPEVRQMDADLRHAVSDGKLAIADIRRKGPRSWRGLVAEDRFHPNEKGYARLAHIFYDAIKARP